MKYLEVKKEGHICWVYLNRPEAMNALSTDVLKEIADFNFSLRDDLESRVVIYAGKGDHFSAGADLKERKIMSKEDAGKALDNFNDCFSTIESFPAPVICLSFLTFSISLMII